MAKGLIGIGRVQKEQSMRALTESAKLEAEQEMANEALERQAKVAKQQTQGTLAGTGAAVGGLAGTLGMMGSVGGPAGAAIGFVAGFVLAELFT